MFNWFWKLLGFQVHEHTWSQWTVDKTLQSSYGGIVKVIQSRKCKTCGYTQIASQEE